MSTTQKTMNHDRDFHVSSVFWQRLLKVFNNSGHTQQTLAETVGCNRKTIQRLLSGETYRDMLSLLYDVSNACGVVPDVLFDLEQELPVIPKTGITSIDRMIHSIYNSTSIGHLEPYAPFVSKKYRMFRSIDEEVSVNESIDYSEGMDYETELRLNLRSADQNQTNRTSKLRKCYIAGEQVVVIYDITISQNDNKGSNRLVAFIDHLELERPLSEHVKNGKLVPKILRRHWAELKERQKE